MAEFSNPRKRKAKDYQTSHFKYASNYNNCFKKDTDLNDEEFSQDIFVSDKRYKQSIYNKTEEEPASLEYAYFEKILETLKDGIPDEARNLFVANALEESAGKEIELSCHHSTSRCIESLLSFCEDEIIWIKFMKAFSLDKVTVCSNPNSSHIVELLIKFAVKKLQIWPSLSEVNHSEENTEAAFFLSWISELGNFVSENLISCLEDQYASHVAISVIQALGGDMSQSSEYKSKKFNHKNAANNLAYSDGSLPVEKVTLENIPKEFEERLKEISKKVRKIENISEYVSEGYGAIVVEVLTSILGKRIPKQCKKFVKHLFRNLFSNRNENGVPVAFFQKNCSFVIEKLFSQADGDFQTKIWSESIDDNLDHVIVHPISNFIIQRLFDFVKSPYLLLVMCEKTGSLFSEVLEAERFGIFLSIASACYRLKVHQALFMKNIMQCLRCDDPPERQINVATLLLNLRRYDDSDMINNSELAICLQGSLLVQSLLNFQKPIKLVKSLLAMKPQNLAAMACHIQGCHVLNSFFKSQTVGEKSKDKLIQCLQPVVTSIACNENGSHTLSRIWVLLTLKQKSLVASALAQDEETVKSHRNGNIVFNKFRVFQHKRNFEQWKEFQSTFLNKNSKKWK